MRLGDCNTRTDIETVLLDFLRKNGLDEVAERVK